MTETVPSWHLPGPASTVITIGSGRATGASCSGGGLPSELEWMGCELTQLGESMRGMPTKGSTVRAAAQVSDAPELSEADADLA